MNPIVISDFSKSRWDHKYSVGDYVEVKYCDEYKYIGSKGQIRMYSTGVLLKKYTVVMNDDSEHVLFEMDLGPA